ncbi:MAG: T9SS type A sorting domain-containing protein [Bacteroidota bacterium]
MRLQTSTIICLSICCLFLFSTSSIAQNIRAVQNGSWHNPSTWDLDKVPGFSDSVFIEDGLRVDMADDGTAAMCAKLTIRDTLSSLMLKDGDFTVTGPILVRKGSLLDTLEQGRNYFIGHLRVDSKGIVRLTKSVPSKLIFEGGITGKGDTIWVKGCRFQGQDQIILGSNPFIATGEVVIANDISLTNQLKSGMILELPNGNLVGESESSTFVNESKITFRKDALPMEVGHADYTFEGNRVLYQGYGDQVILGTTYDQLEILLDPDRNGTTKTLVGDLTVNNLLELGSKTTLDMNGYNIFSLNEAELSGFLVNTDTLLGVANFSTLITKGVRMNGRVDTPLTVIVNDNLLNPSSSSQANDVHLMVKDSMIVGDVNFFVGGVSQVELGYLEVELHGNLFLKAAPGSSYNFGGKIVLDGEMNMRAGDYHFQDSVIIRDSAFFQGKDVTSTYIFEKPIVNNGTFGNSSGMFIFSDDIMGTQPIVISDSLWVNVDAKVVNRNTGGLHSRGEFNGLSEGSSFENAGVLVMESENHFEKPMGTGSFDITTHTGNTVVFGSGEKNQPILSDIYQGLTIRGNQKLISGGDIQVKGDLVVDSETRSEEGLDLFKIIMNGEGDQNLSAAEMGSIQTMEINKPSGKVLLTSDFTVSGLLVLNGGVVESGMHTLSLGTSGQVEESANSYIIGKVATRRSVASNQGRQFGGLGLRIKASEDNALGETLVIRTTGESYQAGQIDRYFEIYPTNNTDLNASVEFTYEERETTGAVELELFLEHSEDGENFTLLEESGIDTEKNVLSQDNINSFNIITAKSVKIPVNAFPSPLYDGEDLTIQYVLPSENITRLNVFDRAGRSIANYQFTGQAGKNSFKLENLQLGAGIFFVRIKSGRLKGYRTFVKITP